MKIAIISTHAHPDDEDNQLWDVVRWADAQDADLILKAPYGAPDFEIAQDRIKEDVEIVTWP